MIKAELRYNPYLMETDIKFNGRKPRINSQVEKYQNRNLKDWAKQIPTIFYNEMNGYDFELEFSGTDLDCQQVVQAFEQAGVSNKEVRIFHKGMLSERATKLGCIESLINWLHDTPNNNFDLSKFENDNTELFEHRYPLICLNKNEEITSAIDLSDVSVEDIEDMEALNNIDLRHIPIVVYIDGETSFELSDITRYLKKRKDVTDNQVFFVVDEALRLDEIIRTLTDLGYSYPQVIKTIDDVAVRTYFELYPQTDYIHTAIEKFKLASAVVGERLLKENELSEINSSEINGRIKELETVIDSLKVADIAIIHRDNLDEPGAFLQAKDELIGKIINWRKSKLKITREAEALGLSTEFSGEVGRNFETFSESVQHTERQALIDVATRLRRLYLVAAYDEEYEPEGISIDPLRIQSVPSIKQDLMQLVDYIPAKAKEPGLFFMSSGNSSEQEAVKEATYYCQKWRDYAVSVIEPMADNLICTRSEVIRDYDNRLADIYHNHLMRLIKQKTEEKDSLCQHLSDEERQLQSDKKWLAGLKEQLWNIERG